MEEINKNWDDPKYGFMFDFERYSFHPKLVPVTDIDAARELAEQAMLPAPPKVILAELARLRVSTKIRAEDERDMALRFQVLAETMEEFPADVAVAALRRWARREVFFPSVAEIVEEMHRFNRRRQSLLTALRR